MSLYKVLVLGDYIKGCGKSTFVRRIEELSAWNTRYEPYDIIEEDEFAEIEVRRSKFNGNVYEIITSRNMTSKLSNYSFDLIIYMIHHEQVIDEDMRRYIKDNMSHKEKAKIIIRNVYGDSDHPSCLSELNELKTMFSMQEVINTDVSKLDKEGLLNIFKHIEMENTKTKKVHQMEIRENSIFRYRNPMTKSICAHDGFRGNINHLIDMFVASLPVMLEDSYAIGFRFDLQYTPSEKK